MYRSYSKQILFAVGGTYATDCTGSGNCTYVDFTARYDASNATQNADALSNYLGNEAAEGMKNMNVTVLNETQGVSEDFANNEMMALVNDARR